MSDTLIHRFVADARAGRLERVVRRMPSGWAVLGDPQIRPGYSLLYPDPVVATLNDLSSEERARFLLDMATLGDAVLEVTGASRINYEILGNAEPALHAHVIPRSADEELALRTKPIWSYDWNSAPKFSIAKHEPLMRTLGRALDRRLGGSL